MDTETKNPLTFKSIFFDEHSKVPIRVPDYQRAYSWERKQVDLFIEDLKKYHDKEGGYYFGHFIIEKIEKNAEAWELVDGQQRITTFVLFLMVCRILTPSDDFIYSFTQRFSTVSYDVKALEAIGQKLGKFLEKNKEFDEKNPPSDEQIINDFGLYGNFTHSQKRMVMALLRFHQAFQKKELEQNNIGNFINVIMKAGCSIHLTNDKSVAVNIFEMHNTRGVPLSTIEIIKAKLMKYVYDNGGDGREAKVEEIQKEFGEIYGMEERLAVSSFRGEMTMEQLFRLHLRVVDDGTKRTEKEFHFPATNATANDLVAYVDSRLQGANGQGAVSEEKIDGVQYALNLAREFKKSVRIISEILPAWDKDEPLVGDVMILERELSCQLFLIICRRLESGEDKADGRASKDALALWEKLLFTRDFHEQYYRRWYGDNFPKLFEDLISKDRISDVLNRYLAHGFRPNDQTKELQSIVFKYLNDNKKNILNNAFHWWKAKMIYAIYKFEISKGAKLRDTMKGDLSVEHILPQEWQRDWIESSGKSEDEIRKEIDDCINGIGNLLLITRSENTSVGNKHPAKKEYKCSGGSYEEREQWKLSAGWPKRIEERGEKIFDFVLKNLIDAPLSVQDTSPQ